MNIISSISLIFTNRQGISVTLPWWFITDSPCNCWQPQWGFDSDLTPWTKPFFSKRNKNPTESLESNNIIIKEAKGVLSSLARCRHFFIPSWWVKGNSPCDWRDQKVVNPDSTPLKQSKFVSKRYHSSFPKRTKDNNGGIWLRVLLVQKHQVILKWFHCQFQTVEKIWLGN